MQIPILPWPRQWTTDAWCLAQIPHTLFGQPTKMEKNIWDVIEKSTYLVSVFRDLDDVIFLYTAQARRFEKRCLRFKKKFWQITCTWSIIFSMKPNSPTLSLYYVQRPFFQHLCLFFKFNVSFSAESLLIFMEPVKKGGSRYLLKKTVFLTASLLRGPIPVLFFVLPGGQIWN